MPAAKKKPQYPESRLQIKVASCFTHYYPEVLWFHIPNGGRRTKAEAGRFRMMGVLPGVFDIFVSETTPLYSGMYMEIKAPGRPATPDNISQKPFMVKAEARGYYCVVVNNLYDAVVELENYLGIPKERRLSITGEKILKQKPGANRINYTDPRMRSDPHAVKPTARKKLIKK